MPQSQHKHLQSFHGLFRASSHSNGHSSKIPNYASTIHHGDFYNVHHQGLHKFHHGTPSVHSGSAKLNVFSKLSSYGHGYDSGKHLSHNHESSFSSFSSHSGHSGWKNDGLLNVNEKETMQLLNERLASYLEKVRSLEQENANLEKKICEWYEKYSHEVLPDFEHYYKTIGELQSKITASKVENARIVLEIDNAGLAADDFRNKYEMECTLRSNIEADVNGLRRILEGLAIERNDLEMQVQNLQEELQQMKKTHEEEVTSLRTQLGARINVQVDAAPSVDLNRALSDVREQYENLMERNLREVESMFLTRSEELNRQVESGSEQLQSVQTDLIDLKRCIQTLGIELKSQQSLKSALERTLAETEGSFQSQLNQLQHMIDNVEEQLVQTRSDLERQIHEYKILMNHKALLEMEIATYKSLMEGHDIHVPENKHKMMKEMSISNAKQHSMKCRTSSYCRLHSPYPCIDVARDEFYTAADIHRRSCLWGGVRRSFSVDHFRFHDIAEGLDGREHCSFASHGGWKNDGMFSVNEKETMQLLNDRLASYLEKVRSLEQENAQLERNIREWYEKHQPSAFPDFSNFFRTIQDLQCQISSATVENARVVLQIDNARLAADDFKNKYEMELRLRNNVEADVSGLRRVLEGLNSERCDLEVQVQNLQEELQQMKRNHEEEVNSLRAQLGQRVNVEVDAAPSVDLNRSLSEIREQYENLMDRNLREVENMFLQRTEELNREVISGSEQLQSVQTEVIELRRSVQTLEIELQSLQSMVSTENNHKIQELSFC
ncbi:keratin, type I cytoskeletal 19-like [Pelobates cultripes]|uniref:Keratin, type I cytoskeletal 19-like n=1 Tax=Pelobates cultripes TaxID=61616 RepID=A0AAD1WB49_PELCU|nr:keratin, type I cytoskeletal 19-like [Pelobates cultripes]